MWKEGVGDKDLYWFRKCPTSSADICSCYLGPGVGCLQRNACKHVSVVCLRACMSQERLEESPDPFL